MSKPAKDYAVTVANVQADRASVLDLWQNGMGGDNRFAAKYQWFYENGPYGPGTILLLRHGPDRTLAGMTGLGTRRLWIDGAPCAAGLLADFRVMPEHRTLFPAMLLQRQMHAVALESNQLLYGMPNKNALPVIKRIGQVHVADLTRYAMVLRHVEYLRASLPRVLATAAGAVADAARGFYRTPLSVWLGKWQGQWLDQPDHRLDALWQKCQRNAGVIAQRDSAFLTWRFVAKPGARFRLFTVRRAQSDALAAYAVCEQNGLSLAIHDLLAEPGENKALAAMLALLARQAGREGSTNISMEFHGPAHMIAAMSRAGFHARSSRPVYASDGSDRAADLASKQWYVTSADEDE